ncbi:hypothetical protein BT96DRAFT_205136 [Gymnopus androsaceus JB14]|uniref:Uncharacterized protein n=1 Tax=Gymnopus androsaceus JB14 TaxID=1447944 RepID=A0A6A4ID73_9AGAR|nr:hypothetical protein BT96DRAFT_205136 [Gymnopus androsaceus JB14]
MAGFDSFDSAFKTTTPRQLEFLDTLKRNSMMHELDSSVSSCSSFDPSDNECNYPSTSHMTAPPSLSSPVSLPSRTQTRSSQAFSDNFPPAFELSPILEDSSAFEDVDDILAYYSDSPVLGRGNESQDYSGFAFDEADWDPEPMFDAETEPKFHVTDADENPAGSRRVRRMSFVLKSTVHGDDSLFDATDDEAECNTFKDLLQPPALTLTFPTPEILGPTLPDPFPLVIEPNQLSPFASIPQTPPSSVRRNALGDITNTLVPPTPLPSLPRCTSCRFGLHLMSLGQQICFQGQ